MSATLLRGGLYIIIIVLAAYVLRDSFEDAPWAELITAAMLQKAFGFGVLLTIGGLVAKLFEKGANVVSKNRCVVCKTPIVHGAIYCREHLRGVLHREDEKTHMTRIRRN